MKDVGEELKSFLDAFTEKNVDISNFSDFFTKADGIRIQADVVIKQEMQKSERIRHQIEEEEKVIADSIPDVKIKDDPLYEKTKMLEEMLNSLALRLELNIYLREIFWRLSYRLVKLLEVTKGMSMATELLNTIQKERKEMYDEQWKKFMEYQEMLRKYNSAFEEELRGQIKVRDNLLQKLATAMGVLKEDLVKHIEDELKLTKIQADKVRKAVNNEIAALTVGKVKKEESSESILKEEKTENVKGKETLPSDKYNHAQPEDLEDEEEDEEDEDE